MTSHSSDLVIVNGRPVVSSLAVAKRFGKDHKNVLRDIRELLTSPQGDFCGLNFEPTRVEVKMPTGGVRKSPAYNLTRDGFTLLAMGFTGPEALAWKIRYIEAFNAMEAELREAAAETPRPRPIRVPAGKRPRSLAVFQDKELIDLLLQGHSQAQAARELGVSETAVYKRLRRLEAERVIQLVRTAPMATPKPVSVLPAPLARNLTFLDGELAGVYAMHQQLDDIAGSLSAMASTANTDPGTRLLATAIHSLTRNASRHLLGLHQTLVLVRGAALTAFEAAATAPRALTPEDREKKRRGGLARAAKERERKEKTRRGVSS